MSDTTTDELLELIRHYLGAGDMRGVAAGLRLLAVASPKDAQAILDALALVEGKR